MIMITVTILALVLVYKSFCNTVCIYLVMQIKLVVVVVVERPVVRLNCSTFHFSQEPETKWSCFPGRVNKDTAVLQSVEKSQAGCHCR